MSTPLRVLVLEDRVTDAELMLHELRRAGFDPDWRRVETEADYLAHLDPALDLILADYALPQFNALRALHLLQERGLDIPFVVLTGTTSEEVAVECLKQGANDYLLKDRLVRLGPAVAHALQQKKLRDEKRRAEERLHRRDAILEAVSYAAERFLEATSWEESIQEVLDRLGEAAGVSRAYIFENHTAQDGTLLTSQRYEWVAAGVTPQIDNPELQELPWIEAGFGRWVETLSKNEVLYGLVHDFPEAERPVLEAQEILSIAIVPISVAGTWWGFMGFDDCLVEREWSLAEIEALRAAAGTLGAAIQRKRAEEELAEERNLLRTLIDNLPDYIYAKDTESRFVLGNIAAAREVGVTTPDKMVGKTDFDFFPEELAARYYANEQEIFRSGQPLVNLEEPVIDHAGNRLWVLTTKVPLRDRQGRIVGLVGMNRDITERERAEEVLRRRAEELAALQATVLEITAPHDLSMLLQTIVERAALLLHAPGGGMYLCDPDQREVRCVVSYNTARDYRETVLKYGEGAAGIVAQTGEPLVIEDYRTWSGRAAVYEEEPFEAILSAPMIWQGQVTGVIHVLDVASRRFTQADLELLTLFADHSAIAVENARLFQETRRRAEELEALAKISSVVRTARTVEEILEILVREAAEVVDAATGNIFLVEPESGDLVARCWHPPAPHLLGVRHRPGEGITGQVASTGEIHISADLASDPLAQVLPQEAERFRDIGCNIALPLRAQEHAVGVMHIGLPKQRLLTREDVRLLTAIADVAANAIQRAMLHEQTREQARQMQQIMDTVPEGMLLLDADRRILLANPVAWEHLAVLADGGAGETLTHLGGRPIEELLQPPSEGLSHEIELDGLSPRIFEVVAEAMEAEPEARGWVLVLRDVSQERQIQARVQQQERLAAIGQLAAGIAHDFNNLLTGMMGFAQLLQMSADIPGHAKADLGQIVQQGRRAAHLIRQVLDFSRKSIITRQPLDLAPFLKEATRFLQRTIPENVHIVLEMAPAEYWVSADLTQLQQVLTNLAVNARDAMSDGGELRFRLSRRKLEPGEQVPFPGMEPGDWVALAVTDTGIGIPPEVLPHIFEPFFTIKEVGEGSGLGLAQVYGIVKQHEGYIDVESQVGVGTTLTVYLPALGVGEEVPAEGAPEEPPRGQGETVLLVEDEPAVLGAGKAMLEHLGYRVLTATNGQEALEVHAEHGDKIALVVSDMVMPKMGGLELYQLLRRQDPAVKMVVVTGYPLGEEFGKLLARGILG